MKMDWSKLIGSVIAAILIAMQVGMDSRLDTHQETMQRDVERVEDSTMHTSTIEAHVDRIDDKFSRIDKDYMLTTDIQEILIQFDSDRTMIENRLLILEREMNSMYQGKEDD